MKAICLKIIMALPMAAIVSGCTLFPPVADAPAKEVISQLPADLPQRATHAATLLVFPPETKPVYDTTQMAYMTRAYQIDYFSRHEWGATPSQMLQPLLVQTLEATHAFSAVLMFPSTGSYTYALRTQILDLVQDFTSDPAMLQLTLRLQLSDDRVNRVIATREIALREPMREKTPYAGVVAANSATAKALKEAAKFVLEKTD